MTSVPLSPVDYLFTGPESQPITFAFYFPQRLDVDRLRISLNEALALFPILRSRLWAVSDYEYEFSIADDGLVFESGESAADFPETAGIERFVTPVESAPEQPLTRISLLRVPPGGTVLGVSVSHALVDGFSYFHFLSSWARSTRGERVLAPYLDRSLLFPAPAAKLSKTKVTAEMIFSDCGLFLDAPRRSHLKTAGPAPIARTFIADEEINDELQRMRREQNAAFTRNDAIVAKLWKEWGADGHHQTFVTCPFDFRGTLTGLPRNFFGCALSFASATIAADALQKASPAELALLVRNAVGRMKNESILKSLGTLDSFRCQQGTTAMAQIHLRHPRSGLIVTNLTRMPIKDIDFGSGPPLRFLTHVDMAGGAAILPAAGGVEVLVAPPPS